jgi:DNA polymerase
LRSDLALERLNRKMQKCRKCNHWKEANNVVPGEGPHDAQVMLVGQNPGEEEDKIGRPFVGRAGTFLNKILLKNNIKRETLFVTNIVKHKTPNNRKPKIKEIQVCMPFLAEQIKIIQPRIIVLLGKVAGFTPRNENMVFIETYHPAAAMRFLRFREAFEQDFKFLKLLLTEN